MKTALGNFTYDKAFKCYNAFVNWNGQNTDVAVLDCKSEEEAVKAVRILSGYAQDMAGFDRDARNYAAEKLLENAKDWADDGVEVTEEAFVSALTMIGLTVFASGMIEVYYDDGDLFAGHAVVVTREADGAFCDADISG